MKKVSLLVLILCLVAIPFVSANGLQIDNKTDINISKFYGLQKEIQFTIINQETFDFYNIQFEQENIIQMTPINLTSGENKTIIANIITNDTYEGILTLRGDYETNIGSSNITEEVQINYPSGFNRCNLELIVGDSVIWINNVLGDIELIDDDTGQVFETVQEGKNKTIQFNYPEELDYKASWLVPFTSVCRINIIDDQGLVHGTEYDYTLNSIINIEYNPTTISTSFLKTDYEMDYDQIKSGSFLIENTGNEIAQSINLESDWIEFDMNNFNIAIGDSETISYTIDPRIFKTNETNKTHIKNIEITGNFEKVTQNISLSINYADINELFEMGKADEKFIREFFLYWCEENPDESLCIQLKNSLSGNSTTTLEFSTNTLAKLMEEMVNSGKEEAQFKNAQLEVDLNQSRQISSLSGELGNVTAQLIESEKSNDNLGKTILFGLIILFSFEGFRYINKKGLPIGVQKMFRGRFRV